MEESFILTNDTKKEFNLVHFKKFFLLEFTRQLIKYSEPSDIFESQVIFEKERREKIEYTKEKIKELIKLKEKEVVDVGEKELSTSAKEIKEGKIKNKPSIMHASIGMFQEQKIAHLNPFENALKNNSPANLLNNYPSYNSFKRTGLSIPESKFPVHIQYIKPVPINKEIELGKINPLITDPMVKVIECYGPGENLIVQGNMGVKKTRIILNKEEIDDIIQIFSRETKIPVQEGVFKVVAGKLIFLAIVSEIVDSKFIIKKMLYEQQPSYRI